MPRQAAVRRLFPRADPRFQRDERSLRQALDHQKVLLDEISHRVKNSLQLVASMFSLQATATQNAGLHRVYRMRWAE